MADLPLAEGTALLDIRTKRLKLLLYAGLGLVIVDMLLSLLELVGVYDLETTENLGLVLFIVVSGLGILIVAIALVIYFCLWIYRAAANVVAADFEGFAYTPGWAVGWFFIPVANIFMPYDAMRQIWNASHGFGGHHIKDNNPLLIAWWATWIASNALGNFALQYQLSGTTPQELNMALTWGVLSGLVDLILYPIAIMMVTQINAAQQRHFRTEGVFA